MSRLQRMLVCWLGAVSAGGCGRIGYEGVTDQQEFFEPDSGSGDPSAADLAGAAGAPIVATPPDSEPEGDASVVATAGSASSAGCPVGTLLCDSFDVDLTRWTSDHNQGLAEIDPNLAWAGAASVRLLAPSRNTHARLRGYIDPPLTQGKLFVRFHVFVAADIVVSEWNVLLEWVWDTAKVSVDFAGDSVQLTVPGGGNITGPVFPRDEWFCLLLEANIAHQGSGALYMNGELAAQGDGDMLPPDGIGELWLSSHAPSKQRTPAEIHIDEFAAATTPLACP